MNATRSGDLDQAGRDLDTTLLKAIAALLVANSHLEHFYPAAWMAGDGLLGNSLFFLLAGYGLVRSERLRSRPFLRWMWRRIARLYPTLFIVVPVASVLVGGGWRHWGIVDYLRTLVWPTEFTFVQLVVPFYLLFFILMKGRGRAALALAMLLLIVPYLAAYVPDAMRTAPHETLHLGSRPILVHASAYFQVMLLGGWLAWRDAGRPRRLAWDAAALAVVSVAYAATKLAMFRGFYASGYAVLHALTFAWCLLAFQVLSAPAVMAAARARVTIWRATSFLGALTLEIYVIHSYIAEYPWVYRLGFPTNLVVFWSLTLPLAWIVGRITSRMRMGARGQSLAPTAAESVAQSSDVVGATAGGV